MFGVLDFRIFGRGFGEAGVEVSCSGERVSIM